MTEVEEVEVGPERLMDDQEMHLAQVIYNAIQRWTVNTPRSAQADNFIIGISDLGTCAERTRRTMAGIVPEDPDTDKLEAFIGSWVGAGVEAAVSDAHPDSIKTQVEVVVALDGDGGHYEITGHADLVHGWGVGDVKGLALDTPLPTPTGWTTMGDVRVGDYLLGSDGRPARITTVSPVKQIDCWRVTFESGHSVVCDDEHRWAVIDRKGKQRTWTVNELARRKALGDSVQVQLVAPLDLPSADLPLDPWVFGYWLGNGSRNAARVTTHGDDADEVDALIRSAGWATCVSPDQRSNATNISISEVSGRSRDEQGRWASQGMTKVLAEMGALASKTVPREYLRASAEQRLALLRGLMDSDGSWNRTRRRVVFVSCDPALAAVVAELARSMGERVQCNSVLAHGYGKAVMSHRVEWAPTVLPFALSRKASRVTFERCHWFKHTVVSVERTLTVPTRCVSVDSPEHTFLCGEAMIPTHNTVDGLTTVKRGGPTRQQLFQRHLLCLGLHQNGLLEVPLDDALTYNVWLDRSGRTKELFVHQDHFSWDVVFEATHWLDEVVYAYRQGVEAAKEPPRPWCEKVCGHYRNCRLFDSDVEGLIFDPYIAAAVEANREAVLLKNRSDVLKRDAQSVLAGINGYVQTADGERFQVRNTFVNGSHVDYDRNGYWRISVTPIRAK